jgi:hypothetical protein
MSFRSPRGQTRRQRPVLLDGPVGVIEGDRVTHLRYRVR